MFIIYFESKLNVIESHNALKMRMTLCIFWHAVFVNLNYNRHYLVDAKFEAVNDNVSLKLAFNMDNSIISIDFFMQ